MNERTTTGVRLLRAAGKRITPQRKLILDILAQTRRHLDAYELHDLGRRRDETLSLATVYRTIALLKESGLVQELHLDENRHHYELTDRMEHAHLVCLGCGQVFEVDGGAFVNAAQEAGNRYGFAITGGQIELTGYCAACRAPQSKQAGGLVTTAEPHVLNFRSR